MLSKEMEEILLGFQTHGWIWEPEAKALFLLGRDQSSRVRLGENHGRGGSLDRPDW